MRYKGENTFGRQALKKGIGIIAVVLLVLLTVAPVASHGAEKTESATVKEALRRLGVSNVEILGIEPSPLKDLWMVYVKIGGERVGAFLLTQDGRYLITGKVLDVSKGGEDITLAKGLEKGYFPLPKGRSLKESEVAINTAGSPAFGAAKAPRVIVYFDPLCPYCMRELQELKPMADAGKISLVLKYFIVHGDKAREIAINSLCLYQEGKGEAFWSYLLSRGTQGAPSREAKCDQGQAELVITRDTEEARKLEIRGTPASIINGKLYTGYLGKTTVEKLLLTGGMAKGK